LFRAGSAPGIRPSELSPPARYPAVTVRKRPLTVSPAFFPAAEAPGRSNGPRFLGFAPCRSPSRPSVCLARQPPDAPLGFTLPGPANERLDQDFARSPLTRFAATATHAPATGTSESQSTPVWSRPLAMQARRVDATTHLGFPHRPGPCRSNEPPPGLWVHLTPRQTLPPTDRRS
jgi:hypothetical protein